MRSILKKIQCALLLLVALNVFGQRDKQVEQIRNDPDWQIIYNNNIDFLNRVLGQSYSLSELWAMGQDNFLQQLNYSLDDYYQKRTETRAAAARLLNKFPELNTPGMCNTCRLDERQLTGKVDAFLSHLRLRRSPDVATYLRETESLDLQNPQCGWKFYACAIVCAGTIEIFPVYLACCALCLCENCRNPPSWCN